MPQLDITKAQASDMTNAISDVEVTLKSTDGIGYGDETEYIHSDWSKWWGYFNAIPDLKSALIMKSIWNCGKGWIATPKTQVILNHISGWGKDTFNDILFNMDLISNICGDSFAEIIRDDDTGVLLNLKVLDPSGIKIVVDNKGIIKEYRQINKLPSKKDITFKPEQILHLCKDRYADSIHGISKIESMEQTILAENESFTDLKKIMHHQAIPFILWKLKTDDPVKIAQIVAKIDAARNLGEDLFIPDDDDAIEYEPVKIDVNQSIFQWRDDIRNKFYRALGLPLILFGQAGSTESGGKIEYLAHENVFNYSQVFLEKQIWNQLNLKIDLIPPTSLLENLQTDQNKDMSASGLPQGAEIQQNDVTAGSGA